MSPPSSTPDPAPGSGGPKLITRLRSAVRARHYSARTEESYVGWVKRFVRFHGMRHPAELAEALRAYMTDPHLRVLHGKAARQRAVEEFALGRMARRYADLYHALTPARAETDKGDE